MGPVSLSTFAYGRCDLTTANVKVCGCRPHDGGAADTGGRRTQTSKGGNRGRCGGVGASDVMGISVLAVCCRVALSACLGSDRADDET